MLDLTFGTDADAQRIVDTINGIHDHIHGRLGAATGIFPAGTPFPRATAGFSSGSTQRWSIRWC